MNKILAYNSFYENDGAQRMVKKVFVKLKLCSFLSWHQCYVCTTIGIWNELCRQQLYKRINKTNLLTYIIHAGDASIKKYVQTLYTRLFITKSYRHNKSIIWVMLLIVLMRTIKLFSTPWISCIWFVMARLKWDLQKFIFRFSSLWIGDTNLIGHHWLLSVIRNA